MKRVDVKTQYNKIGKEYNYYKKLFFSNKEDKAITFIKKFLPELKDKTILDIGCGGGHDIKLLESLGAKDIFGIDSSKYMINEAKTLVKKPGNLVVGSIEKTPFKTNFFDIAIGRFSLHFLENLDKAYKEIARILKKGGLLIFVVQHPLNALDSQKIKKYGKQEIITVKLYHGRVKVSFPSHTFNDYFSPAFFRHFYLDYFEEGANINESAGDFKIPESIKIKAIKRQ